MLQWLKEKKRHETKIYDFQLEFSEWWSRALCNQNMDNPIREN